MPGPARKDGPDRPCRRGWTRAITRLPSSNPPAPARHPFEMHGGGTRPLLPLASTGHGSAATCVFACSQAWGNRRPVSRRTTTGPPRVGLATRSTYREGPPSTEGYHRPSLLLSEGERRRGRSTTAAPAAQPVGRARQTRRRRRGDAGTPPACLWTRRPAQPTLLGPGSWINTGDDASRYLGVWGRGRATGDRARVVVEDARRPIES